MEWSTSNLKHVTCANMYISLGFVVLLYHLISVVSTNMVNDLYIHIKRKLRYVILFCVILRSIIYYIKILALHIGADSTRCRRSSSCTYCVCQAVARRRTHPSMATKLQLQLHHRAGRSGECRVLGWPHRPDSAQGRDTRGLESWSGDSRLVQPN